MLLPHMVVKGKVGSIPVQFYCLSLHIKSIEIACGISDVWDGSMYWLSSKWSEQIWYELYNCFAVFEPRSPGLVCMTHFLDLLRGGAGRKTVLVIFQSTHFIYIYYDQYKKYGEKTKLYFSRASFPWKWRPSLILGHSPRYI